MTGRAGPGVKYQVTVLMEQESRTPDVNRVLTFMPTSHVPGQWRIAADAQSSRGKSLVMLLPCLTYGSRLPQEHRVAVTAV